MRNGIAFASEIKALLAHPDVRPDVDRRGLWELLFLSPVRLSGGIFRDVCEIDPACHAVWRDGEELMIDRYWELEAKPCDDSREEMNRKDPRPPHGRHRAPARPQTYPCAPSSPADSIRPS